MAGNDRCAKVHEFSLGKDFCPAVISVGKTRIIIEQEGVLNVTTEDNMEIRSTGRLLVNGRDVSTSPRASAEGAPATAEKTLQVGDRMKDGTIYAGISPDTNAPMYAMPADAPLTMKWKDAMKYAANFEGHGKPKGSFRVPTYRELNILYKHSDRIGGFNETGSECSGMYWSSTKDFFEGKFQNFRDGWQDSQLKFSPYSIRLVCS